jgi:hypothetical protein
MGGAAAARTAKTGRPLPAVVTVSAAASPIVAANESTVEPACLITTRPSAGNPSSISRRAASTKGVREDAINMSPLGSLAMNRPGEDAIGATMIMIVMTRPRLGRG